MKLKLIISTITDLLQRENFKKVEDAWNGEPLLRGNFKFFSYTVQARGSFPKTLEVAHNLGFQPKDVVTLSVADADGTTLTWNYDDFTKTHVNFTVSAACTVRAFLGRYSET